MEKIYTHDEAAKIVELFENVLLKANIRVPSSEDDDRGDDDYAALYGSVYYDLLDEVEYQLINLLGRHEPDTEVVESVFFV